MTGRPGKLLLVEDNAVIRSTLKDALDLEGYEIREAGNGREALDALAQPPLPNLILLDLLMPVMDGWGLISELKRDPGNPLANIPIIVVSAVGDRTHGIRSLVQDVIQKPIMLDKLIHAIQRFCPLP